MQLTTPKNSLNNTKKKKKKVTDGYKMVPFDLTSSFTNVPLEETFEIIFKRIYLNKEITTDISKQEMKELLILCT